jgi:DNA modification methylase
MKLYNGDCLEIMKTIQDKSIDAIITDPPYGTTACKWDSVIPFDLMWEQLNRIIKPNGAIVLFGSEPFSSALRMSNIKNYKYDWKWLKEQGVGQLSCKKRPLKKTEDIMIFNTKTYNPQGLKDCNIIKKAYKKNTIYNAQKDYVQKKTGYPNNILKFNRELKNRKHPTQKPLALMEYLIKTYTNELETILDFTMGSGSTGVACCNTNRDFIGIELDKDYFKIAEQRIKNKL